MGLSETYSNNYKIIRDYVKHHASTPVNTDVDPTITDQSYNPDYIVKSIKQQQKTLTEYEIQSIIQGYQNGASSYDLAKSLLQRYFTALHFCQILYMVHRYP